MNLGILFVAANLNRLKKSVRPLIAKWLISGVKTLLQAIGFEVNNRRLWY